MMRRAIRHGLELSLALGMVLVLAAPVAAAKPDRSFAEAGDIVVSGYCDFDVIEHPLSNNEYFTTFFDRDGNVTRSHVAGHLVLELINVESGHSIVVNASGPGRFVDDADGTTVLTGGNWVLNFAGRFFMLNGRGVFRVDANGETIVAIRGHVTDLCPPLAD
jgi:hypothetical protein